jgi:hypothetical protein
LAKIPALGYQCAIALAKGMLLVAKTWLKFANYCPPCASQLFPS